jgi:hypothetical protein
MKSYTYITQSKKLAEILPVESTDMYYYTVNGDWEWYETPNVIERRDDLEEHAMPAWSLAALLDILPSEFKYYETTYEIDIRKYVLTDDVDLYQIAYRNCKIDEDGHHSWKDMINTGEKEDLLDACVEMIIKLKEKDLL